MSKHKIGRHGASLRRDVPRRRRRYGWNLQRHFVLLTLLSIAAVFTIAVLSRSELRLSGELLAAGDGDDLAILTKMGSYDRVELIRETGEVRLYVLSGRRKDYLVEVERTGGGEWEVTKVEELRR